jgi:hypothetical protein
MTLMLRLRPGHGAQIYGYLNAFYQNYIIYMRAQLQDEEQGNNKLRERKQFLLRCETNFMI